MRILRLRLHNLNSLTGKWELDFTHPAFMSDGIFAITGPTGAGKTTILDAICLALYGRTPRLDRVTKGGNEIMSRQSGECSAEVEFATIKGIFRSSWYQHRGRKQADGALQPPKRELSEVESGRILTTKANEVAQQVEEYTGMDFDRFTRSMLLAQGGFAAFLQASQDERAPILEQITGSAIYSEISKRVHARFTDEQAKQKKLEERTGSMQLLTPAEAATIQAELDKQRQEETQLNTAMEERAAALAWLNRIKALREELERITKEQEGLTQEEQTFAEDAARLKAAQQALVLGGDYAQLLATREQQAEERATVEALWQRLPAQEQALAQIEERLARSKDQLMHCQRNWDQGHSLLKQVRELDLRIREKEQAIGKEQAIHHDLQQKNGAGQKQTAQFEQDLSLAQAQQRQSRTYLDAHQVDEQLMSDLAGICKTLARLREIADKQAALGPALEKAEQQAGLAAQAWQAKVQACTAAEKHLATLRQQRQEVQEEAGARLQGRQLEELRREQLLLAEQRNILGGLLEILRKKEVVEQELTKIRLRQKELAEANKEQEQQLRQLRQQQDQAQEEVETRRTLVEQAKRIRDLEEERTHLRKNTPCPLCGALEHPYATGDIPPLNEYEKNLQAALTAAKQAEQALNRAEVQAARLIQDGQNLAERTREKQEAIQEAEERIAEQCREFEALAPGAENSLQQETPSALTARLGRLEERLSSIQQQLEALEQLDRKLARLSKSLEEQQAKVNQTIQEQERAVHVKEQTEQEQQRLGQEQQATAKELEQIRALALEELAAYGITELRLPALSQILADLTTRKDCWQQQQKACSAAGERITALQTELREVQAGMNARAAQLANLEQAIAEDSQQRQALGEERFQLFGEKKNPDAEERKLTTARNQAEERVNQEQKTQSQLLRECELTRAGIKEREASINKRTEALTGLEEAFLQRLQENQYTNEAAWQAARLPEEERGRLQKRAEALQNRRARLDERLQDRQTRLQEEEQLRLTETDSEELSKEHTALITARRQATERIGSLNQQLQADKEQRARQQDLLTGLEAQKKECLRWKELHDLIGSADGKKYRNFAQGLTFELMVSRANEQLARMTDRYLLVRDQAQPLELNVIDSWQAGEIRSTKNLSGGESFVVSLALALGLSEMVGGNVRVDSLFLDEGFGALDEEALETALETLAGLRREGKLIGVISHVGALKERIACQLEVVPGTGGQSVVQGAGVRRVE
ncbi:MAG: AAA family ATPase [Candidatus Electrothrix sp. GW3-4]|uniref:SbcC/MukB-like Walker B domain-containing protein n=1 Tax=Candidatus Electrothrix sp. GW3-4 TaxID=3126740 RepID=UPI0030CCFDB8